MKTQLEKGQFTIDGENYFDGYHNPLSTWNGFACPCFELDVCRAIVEDLQMDTDFEFSDLEIKEKEEGYVVNDWQRENMPTVDGMKELFALGAYAWVWEVKEAE